MRISDWSSDVCSSDLVRLVPDLVFVGVVDHEDLARLPISNLVADPNAALFPLAGHDKAEMGAEDALRHAGVRRDVVAGRQDRDPSRVDLRHAADDLGGDRPLPDGALATLAEDEQARTERGRVGKEGGR